MVIVHHHCASIALQPNCTHDCRRTKPIIKHEKKRKKHIHINQVPAARLALHRVTTGSSGDSFSRDKIYLILIASVSFQIK